MDSLLTDSPAEVCRAAASTLALLWWDTNNQEIVQRLLGQYEQIDSTDRNMLVDRRNVTSLRTRRRSLSRFRHLGFQRGGD